MDEHRRALERRLQREGNLIEWLNQVGRWQSGNALEKPLLSSETDSSLLYVVAPLEFAAMTYAESNESFLRVRDYYQNLINYIANFPGTIIALTNEVWTREALSTVYRDPRITSLSTEMHYFLLSSSQTVPLKLIYGTEMHIRNRFKSDILTKIYNNQKISCFDPIFDDKAHQVYFCADRLDRLLPFVREFIQNVNELDVEHSDEFSSRIMAFIALAHCYGYSARSGEYASTSHRETHRASQVAGWSSGEDPILPLPEFVRQIEASSGALVRL